MQQLKSLRGQRDRHHTYPGNISAVSAQTRNEAKRNRVTSADEDNRDCRRRRFCGQSRVDAPNRGDQGNSTPNEICPEGRQPIVTKVSPPELDRHILALNVAGFFQSLAEGGGDVGGLTRRPGAEISD